MTHSIFIKTWKNDLPWLRYCLESIDRFGSGFDEIVVVADESCRGLMDSVNTESVKIHYAKDWQNGKIQQQAVKLRADTFVTSSHILYVDSDVIFFESFTPETFMKDGKPILMKTLYSTLGDAVPWRSPTERTLGWSVDWEYMRRLPSLYRTETLTAIANMFPKLQSELKAMGKRNDFSEFNVIGAFAAKMHPEKYFICDTEVWEPHQVAQQFWSWGGITPEVLSKIEDMFQCRYEN